ncbi:DUF1446-like protein [Alternaria alternata]|nr:DUF1446-like protein [Alternaria alternata]
MKFSLTTTSPPTRRNHVQDVQDVQAQLPPSSSGLESLLCDAADCCPMLIRCSTAVRPSDSDRHQMMSLTHVEFLLVEGHCSASRSCGSAATPVRPFRGR